MIVELAVGETPYKGEPVPSIILKTISPPIANGTAPTTPKPKSDLDDDIPF
jgi:hypothetical protein